MTKLRHHVLIAGPGRGGTSLLVQYLHECGIETALRSRHTSWDEYANAGLESEITEKNAPYVVKSPWISEYVQDIFKDSSIHIDGCIIPIRDLDDAAMSRVITSLRRLYHSKASLTKFSDLWHTWREGTPGGIVYSLEPIDQKRVLAVQFYELVERLEAQEIPFVLLHFPGFAQDHDYLYDKMKAIFPQFVDKEKSKRALKGTFDKTKIRVMERRDASRVADELNEADRSALLRERARLLLEIDVLNRKVQDKEKERG